MTIPQNLTVANTGVPESWRCIDCNFDTAPGCWTLAQWRASVSVLSRTDEIEQTFDDRTEVYILKRRVWKATGVKPDGGCLCIGCVESRLGRRLTKHDFDRRNELNWLPGTERLLSRREGWRC
jgi:hypothetical protein